MGKTGGECSKRARWDLNFRNWPNSNNGVIDFVRERTKPLLFFPLYGLFRGEARTPWKPTPRVSEVSPFPRRTHPRTGLLRSQYPSPPP